MARISAVPGSRAARSLRLGSLRSGALRVGLLACGTLALGALTMPAAYVSAAPLSALKFRAGSVADAAHAGAHDGAKLWLVSGAGEAGEGGEGPGFDAALAKTDPVVFLTALEMAAAHYHAGRAAYASGNRTEGTEMFAHGISEVYVDLEPALQQNGVADFKAQMEKAVELANAGKPQAEVDAAVDAVLASLVAARQHAPVSSETAAAVRRHVFAEVMNRAAHNYMIAARGTSRDAYLDGYGYRVAAEQRAGDIVADLKTEAPASVPRIEAALAALKTGYSSIEKPSTGSLPPGDLLVAVSKALLAIGSTD